MNQAGPIQGFFLNGVKAPEFPGGDPFEMLLDAFGPSTDTTYGARPTKRGRRTKADMAAVRDALQQIVDEYDRMTVRQIYYQAVSRGVIDKTEVEYKSTICRLLADMRRDGTIPYDKIADNTRWMRKPRTYSGLHDMLENTHRTYRRALWDEQDAYVEIWLEKEALAGVLVEITSKWDVPLMVTRGYPSISYVHSAAETIEAQGKPAYLFYFGDHDPSGVDIDRCLEKQLRELTDAEIHIERVAVTRQQIAEFELPTRPTKKSDSRSKNFVGESVEVDAIDPETLCDICDSCIRRHIDLDSYYRMRQVEDAERDTLATMIANMGGEL